MDETFDRQIAIGLLFWRCLISCNRWMPREDSTRKATPYSVSVGMATTASTLRTSQAVLNLLPNFTSQKLIVNFQTFRQPCGCLHQWRYKTEGDSLYIGYNAWRKALNVGVSDSAIWTEEKHLNPFFCNVYKYPLIFIYIRLIFILSSTQ